MTTTASRRRGRTGRPPLTSRAILLGAARKIGFEGLTVGRVTKKVGVKYSTFYRHFPSVDVLVAELVDELLGELDLPDRHRWRHQLADTAARIIGVLEAWPGMADAIDRLPDTPAWLNEARDRAELALTSAGVGPDRAAEGADAVLTLALLDPQRACPAAVELVLDGIASRLEAAA